MCIFGFLGCPFLDATFLRARERLAGARGSMAFTLGFGVFFLLMIFFTAGYAGYGYTSAREAGARSVALPVLTALGAHWLIQFVFTFHVHAREAVRMVRGDVEHAPPQVGRRTKVRWWCVSVLLALGLMLAPRHADMSMGEVGYRLFMTFYGLIFPAYAWLCMIPTRDGHAGTQGARGKFKLRVMWVAVALASPCYWMGFIERETWWLAPGLGIVLAARLVVMGARGREDEAVLGGGV